VLNDEAHHCYREKPESEEECAADERDDVRQNNEAARLWISGLEAVTRKLGIRPSWRWRWMRLGTRGPCSCTLRSAAWPNVRIKVRRAGRVPPG